MKPKFKIGDRVQDIITGSIGNITLIDDKDDYNIFYEVRWYDGEESFVEEESLELTELDKKTLFLHDLRMLLKNYNARIYDYGRYRIYADIGNETISWYTNQLSEITPQNIFDYDKD